MDQIPTLLDLPESGEDSQSAQEKQLAQDGVLNPVARVILDTNQLGLTGPLDYLIPPQMDQDCQVGVLVRVRVGPRLLGGIVVGRQATTNYHGKLKEITALASSRPLLNEKNLETLYAVSRHYGTFPSQILRFVLPKVHQGAEREFVQNRLSVAFGSEDSPTNEFSHWHFYTGGTEYAQTVSQGELVRAVWTTLPHPSALPPQYSWIQALLELVAGQLRAGKQVLVLVPTWEEILHLANAAEAFLATQLPDLVSPVGIYHSMQGEKSQYLTYLKALSGQLGLIIAARAGAWLPLARPGLLVIVDPHNAALRETKNPGIAARQVLLYRSQIEQCSLLLADYSLSAADYQLVQRGWACPLAPPRQLRRELGPRVQIFDEFSAAREGPRASLTLSSQAITLARRALNHGPVLVHTPFSGYHQVIACASCGTALSCRFCGGPLERRVQNNLICKWCSRLYTNDNVCLQCGSGNVRLRTVGIGRVGEELGRLFPQTSIMVSSPQEGKLVDLDSSARVVVSVPGSEPSVPGGYAAALILEPQALDGRTELWVPREIMRRFLHVAALLRPGAPLLIAGPVRSGLDQFLIRTDCWAAAAAELEQLQQTGFPPARRIAVIRGEASAMEAARDYLRTHLPAAELLGPVWEQIRTPQQIFPSSTYSRSRVGSQSVRKGAEKSNEPIQPRGRLLVRCTLKDASSLGRVLQNLQLTWHAQHGSFLAVTVDPEDPG